jgi:hypothetical protein
MSASVEVSACADWYSLAIRDPEAIAGSTSATVSRSSVASNSDIGKSVTGSVGVSGNAATGVSGVSTSPGVSKSIGLLSGDCGVAISQF